MKLYELQVAGEKEWIAANTIIEALQVYHDATGNNIWDFDRNDEIVEVPEENWESMVLFFPDDEDEPTTNFSIRMKQVKKPEYLASTVY